MRYIFLEKSCTKCGREISARPFHKKSKLRISLDQQSKMLYSLFLLYVQVEVYQNVSKTTVLTTCFYLTLSFFKKQKEV